MLRSISHLRLLLRHITKVNKVIEEKWQCNNTKVISCSDFQCIDSVGGNSLLNQKTLPSFNIIGLNSFALVVALMAVMA